jgi:citrate synthase
MTPNGLWWQPMANSLTAAEAARRLGVKPATLYAYVSRGVLSRGKAADGRGSLFDAAEIERLARRGRPRRPAGTVDLTVESAITELAAGSLRFRGHDATRLAVTRTFEEVAELLWTGEFPSAQPVLSGAVAPVAWQATPTALATGRAAQAALPAGTLPLERLQVIVPAMAATDALRLQLDPSAVRAAARSLIAGMVDCLPAPSGSGSAPAGQTLATPSAQAPSTPSVPSGSGASIAGRLWSRLCDRRPAPELLRAVGRARAAGRPRARRLHAGRPGGRVGTGGSVRRGRDRPGRDERCPARRCVPGRGDPARGRPRPAGRAPGGGRTAAPR